MIDGSQVEYQTLRSWSREKDSKESWEKGLLKTIRRDSMQQKPNMCLDADGPVEFHSGESDEVRDSQIICREGETTDITTVHPACFELFSSISHSAVSDVTVCFPLLDRLL